MAFNGLFIQRRIIHKRGDGGAAPPVDGMEINPAAAVRYRPVDPLVKPLDPLPGDGGVLFGPLPLNHIALLLPVLQQDDKQRQNDDGMPDAVMGLWLFQDSLILPRPGNGLGHMDALEGKINILPTKRADFPTPHAGI
ncbi:MAG: hypothetical protein PUE61_04735 [Clostridiales bacterium]|nr:hypothetical protein [Clostridiales bacterium]